MSDDRYLKVFGATFQAPAGIGSAVIVATNEDKALSRLNRRLKECYGDIFEFRDWDVELQFIGASDRSGCVILNAGGHE